MFTDRLSAFFVEMKGRRPKCVSLRPFDAMANLQTISAGILEEYCIVTRSFIVAGPLDLAGSCLSGRLGQPVHLLRVLCPKRNPALIGLM